MPLPDALRDALGQVIATQRAEWRREREVMAAETRAALAEMRAENAALQAALRDAVAERLASVRDGRDGRDGVDGSPGQDAAAVTAADLDAAVARHMADHPPPAPRDGQDGAPGRDGRDADPIDMDAVRAMVDAAVAAAVAALPPPRDGRDGQDGADGRDGAPGRLPLVTAWEDRVHYAGDVVTHDGAVWQAARDTGRPPGHDDWIRIVAAGRDGADGRSFSVRGTWSDAEAYQALDVVALNGASFVARRDEPGPCPGDGWQLMSAQGKAGKPGAPGPAGVGLRGPAGPAVTAIDVDDMGVVSLRNGDGTAVTLDLYPLLASIARR